MRLHKHFVVSFSFFSYWYWTYKNRSKQWSFNCCWAIYDRLSIRRSSKRSLSHFNFLRYALRNWQWKNNSIGPFGIWDLMEFDLTLRRRDLLKYNVQDIGRVRSVRVYTPYWNKKNKKIKKKRKKRKKKDGTRRRNERMDERASPLERTTTMKLLLVMQKWLRRRHRV